MYRLTSQIINKFLHKLRIEVIVTSALKKVYYLKSRFNTMSTCSTQAVMSAKKQQQPPLIFKIIAECQNSKARTGLMILPHSDVDTPVFMPVGTQVNQN